MRALKKILSAAAAGLLTLVMMSPGVYADETNPAPAATDTLPITKTLVTEEKSKNVRPATGLRFRFTATGTGDAYDPTAPADTEFAGPDGALTISEALEGTANSVPGKLVYSGASVHADGTAFPGPGTYVYTLAEQPNPEGDAKYDGIRNDTSKYQIKVHVSNVDGAQKVDGIVASRTDNPDAKVAELSFANTYEPGCVNVKKS